MDDQRCGEGPRQRAGMSIAAVRQLVNDVVSDAMMFLMDYQPMATIMYCGLL
jgi:hypothetical protein